jgi:hypothetical protein
VKGLRIDGEQPKNFTRVFASVMREFDRHYWLIESESGPFSITDKPNFAELELSLNRYRVSVSELDYTSSSLWRPGALRFADLLVIDEWTTFVGILGKEEQATKLATEIFDLQGIFLQPFERILQKTDCVLIHVDGWWEAYSGNAMLLQKLRQGSAASEVDSDVLWK